MDTTFSSDNFEIYNRNLPHWRADHVIYFVTWRLNKINAPLMPEERSLVANTIEHFHERRYHLIAYVVMDDHVHILVTLEGKSSLEKTVHSWKSFTANLLQRLFNRELSIWQQEYYDRIVRNGSELNNIVQYVTSNPRKRWPETKEYSWLRVYDL